MNFKEINKASDVNGFEIEYGTVVALSSYIQYLPNLYEIKNLYEVHNIKKAQDGFTVLVCKERYYGNTVHVPLDDVVVYRSLPMRMH